jgi:hypothetical protein
VPGRAHLHRQQPARGGRVRVDLVDDRQAAGNPVRHQHALVAGHQHRADPGPGRQQGSQPGGSLVEAQPGRHDRHHLGVAWRRVARRHVTRHRITRHRVIRRHVTEPERQSDAGPGPAGGGHAGRQHAQPAGRSGDIGHGHHRGIHRP